jgi:hypothetical protein
MRRALAALAAVGCAATGGDATRAFEADTPVVVATTGLRLGSGVMPAQAAVKTTTSEEQDHSRDFMYAPPDSSKVRSSSGIMANGELYSYQSVFGGTVWLFQRSVPGHTSAPDCPASSIISMPPTAIGDETKAVNSPALVHEMPRPAQAANHSNRPKGHVGNWRRCGRPSPSRSGGRLGGDAAAAVAGADA